MSKTSAKVIANTQHPRVPTARITTIEVYAPRFLLAEVNTHGVLAKSAASSRAIPVKKRIDMVVDHGFVPAAFSKNKPGMQADEWLDGNHFLTAESIWKKAMDNAVESARQLADSDVHKQHANRILEPFSYYHGVITATEWDNFFALRLHPDAQPEFQDLAAAMRYAMDEAKPRIGCEHLPYVDGDGEIEAMWTSGKITLEQMFKVSAARCARVSYKTHDGKPFNLDADLALCEQLIKGGHMSPFEHAARADSVGRFTEEGVPVIDNAPPCDQDEFYWNSPEDHRRLWGWIPDRVEVERTAGMPPSRRSSFAPLEL